MWGRSRHNSGGSGGSGGLGSLGGLSCRLSPQGLRCNTHFFPATEAGQQAWIAYLAQYQTAPRYCVIWLVAWAEEYKLFPYPQQKLRRRELQTWQGRRFAETWPELWDKATAQADPTLVWAVAHRLRPQQQDILCWQVIKDVPAIVPWIAGLRHAGIALAGIYSSLNALPAYLAQQANTATAPQFAVLLPIFSEIESDTESNAAHVGWQQLWCTAQHVLVARSFPGVATWQHVYTQEMPRLYEYVRSQGIVTNVTLSSAASSTPVYVFATNNPPDLPPHKLENAAFTLQLHTLAGDFLTQLCHHKPQQQTQNKGMVQLAPAHYRRMYRWQEAKRAWYGVNLALSACALLATIGLGQVLTANQRLLPLLEHGVAYQAAHSRAWQAQHPLPRLPTLLPIEAEHLQALAVHRQQAQQSNQQLHQQWQVIQQATTLATTTSCRIVLHHLAWQESGAESTQQAAETQEKPAEKSAWQLEGRLLAATARNAAEGLREYVNVLHTQGFRSTLSNAPGNAIAPEQWSAGQLGFSPDGDGRFRFRMRLFAEHK